MTAALALLALALLLYLLRTGGRLYRWGTGNYKHDYIEKDKGEDR